MSIAMRLERTTSNLNHRLGPMRATSHRVLSLCMVAWITYACTTTAPTRGTSYGDAVVETATVTALPGAVVTASSVPENGEVVKVPDWQAALAIGLTPPSNEFNSDVWLLRPPFNKLTLLRSDSGDHAYCCPKWSPDGTLLAYVATSRSSSLSSIWVYSLIDDSHVLLADDFTAAALQPGVRTIRLIGWTPMGDGVVFTHQGVLLVAEFPSGTVRPVGLEEALLELGIQVAEPTSHIANYSQVSGAILMWDRTDDLLRFPVIWIKRQTQPTLLSPPSNYSPLAVPNSVQWFRAVMHETSLSADGSFGLFSAYDRSAGREQLWLVDLGADLWEIVVGRPLRLGADSVAWSGDRAWAAWWIAGDLGYSVTLYDTDGWAASRTAEALELQNAPAVLGWTTSPGKHPSFGILAPDRGLVLLDPSGNSSDDIVLAPYDMFAQSLPLTVGDAINWEWQP